MGRGNLDAFVQHTQRQLVRVMRENSIPGRLIGGHQAAQLLVWNIKLTSYTQTDVNRALSLTRAIELATQTEGVRLMAQRGNIVVEVPSPVRKVLLAKRLPKPGGLVVPLGWTTSNRPLALDFGVHPHLLVLGSTGAAGKSETLRTVCYGLIRQNLPHQVSTAFIDLKGGQTFRDLEGLVYSPFPVATSVDEAEHIIRWAIDTLRKRHHEEHVPQPHIFLFIDEVYLLTTSDIEGMGDMLGELTALGRSAGISMVVASQEANVRTLGTTQVGRNIVTRVTGRVIDASSSFWALGIKGAGAEKLIGNGDVLLSCDGKLTRCQIGLTLPEDLSGFPRGEQREIETIRERTHGNQLPLRPEWIEWFRKHGDGKVSRLMTDRQGPRLSSSVAYRVVAAATEAA